MTPTRWMLALLLCLPLVARTQEVKGIIADRNTKTPIPYATVITAGQYAIANDQGQFKIYPNPYNINDSIAVQIMGYLDFKAPIGSLKDTLYLDPNPIALNEVILLNQELTAEELIERTKEAFEKNYKNQLQKKRVFLRETTEDSIRSFQMELIKSTYEQIDESLIAALKKSMPTKSTFFIETLLDFYGLPMENKNKVDIIKTYLLRDENNTIDSDIIERKMGVLLEKKSKQGSYFKLKSGMFSTKLDLENFTLDTTSDSIKPAPKSDKELLKERKNHTKGRSKLMEDLYKRLIYSEESYVDIFEKSNRYHFEIIDLKEREGDYLYTITFNTKRKSGYYGTLLINATDAAVEMISYHNKSDLKSFSLFGFKFRDHLASGTQLYRKNGFGYYDLVFVEENKGTMTSIERPLKLIEKRKTGSFKRKQNELSFEFSIQLSSVKKIEFMLMDAQPIEVSTYEEFLPRYQADKTRLQQFDPHYWDGYSILEPNDLIRDFKVQ